MNLTQKIETYDALKKQSKMITLRLDELRHEIIEEVGESKTVGDYEVTLEVRRQKPQVDEVALEQLIVDKNLAPECMTLKVDHDLVAQAYIEGKITDEDLREVNRGQHVTVALKVDKVKRDVQTDDESLC